MPKRAPHPSPKSAGPIDLHIGTKLREARRATGMSQGEFGVLLGVTFQQIQKYESGQNRITASRLYEMCKALRIDMMSIFDSLPKGLR